MAVLVLGWDDVMVMSSALVMKLSELILGRVIC